MIRSRASSSRSDALRAFVSFIVGGAISRLRATHQSIASLVTRGDSRGRSKARMAAIARALGSDPTLTQV